MKLQDGFTLVHEHMSIDLTPGDIGTGSYELLCRDLKQAYQYGVRNIVDMTNQSMGRAPEHVRRLSEETGINIILSTGYYLEQYLGKYIENASVEEIAAGAVRDLTTGIGNTGSRAGVIGEIAWCCDGPGELELKAWEAMCIAARKTGAVVSTHPSRGSQQIPQAEYLISHGIPPEKIVIGHIEFFPDDDPLKKLLGTGVYIGLDMIGKSVGDGDDYRAEVVCQVKEWGYLSRLMLSLDICRVQDLRAGGGYGYAHLFESFLPKLYNRGISAEEIELMLRHNPKRLFG
ncbi:MAG: phosphotriesterase-related protein [Eubacteriales bacterium]|nr:phosphotriesterase-related protein [Eubacteriales bacterium]